MYVSPKARVSVRAPYDKRDLPYDKRDLPNDKRDLYACYINSSDQASFFRLPVTVYRQGTVKPVVLSPFPSAPV
jgi:hypothetical protein